eukprot:m.43527 g.43527  ORF g.43527 m.43527 type:complete len:142 (+) comp46731_c0_seq1:336-761(+)
MIAALGGVTECTTLLLQHGADVTLKDSSGRTAVNYAWQGDHMDVVALLEDHARFVAQIGAHTKPALRSQPPVSESVLVDVVEEPVHVFSLLDHTDVEGAAPLAQPASITDMNVRPAFIAQPVAPQPAMDLALTTLEDPPSD